MPAGLGVPLATGVAVLRYRLYDLGLVVKKTLVFAVVATMLTALYGILVFIVPLLVLGVGSGSGFSPWQYLVTIVIGVLVRAGTGEPASSRTGSCTAAGPPRTRCCPTSPSGWGRRTRPTTCSHGWRSCWGASTGAAEVNVLLKTGDRLVPSTTWPERSDDTPAGEGADDVAVFPVVHQGEELGAITLRMSARDPMNPAKEQLVRDVASQAGLVLRNVRLINDLRETPADGSWPRRMSARSASSATSTTARSSSSSRSR